MNSRMKVKQEVITVSEQGWGDERASNLAKRKEKEY